MRQITSELEQRVAALVEEAEQLMQPRETDPIQQERRMKPTPRLDLGDDPGEDDGLGWGDVEASDADYHCSRIY